VFYGFNTEPSWQPRRFSRSFWNLEFRPILGMRSGRWEFITNPIVDLGIGGHEPSAFVPANRIAYAVRDNWSLGVETYLDFGPVGRFPKFNRQTHQVFAATDSAQAGGGEGWPAAGGNQTFGSGVLAGGILDSDQEPVSPAWPIYCPVGAGSNRRMRPSVSSVRI
jgi:hypothetical protein